MLCLKVDQCITDFGNMYDPGSEVDVLEVALRGQIYDVADHLGPAIDVVVLLGTWEGGIQSRRDDGLVCMVHGVQDCVKLGGEVMSYAVVGAGGHRVIVFPLSAGGLGECEGWVLVVLSETEQTPVRPSWSVRMWIVVYREVNV